MSELRAYLDLVQRMSAQDIARSENDLSARLARYLESLGLSTVLDTGGGADRRRRPDILGYADPGDADLVTAADVVIESKKPAEVVRFSNLSS